MFKNCLSALAMIIVAGVSPSFANDVCKAPSNGGSALDIDVQEILSQVGNKKFYTCDYTKPKVDVVGQLTFNLKCPGSLELGIPGFMPNGNSTVANTKLLALIPKVDSSGVEQLDLVVQVAPLIGKDQFHYSVFALCR